MKKFLALMFVCAGLSAMAITPRAHVNLPKMDKEMKTQRIGDQKAMPMVLKSNTFAKELISPALRGTKVERPLTPQRFFEENNLTPADNMLTKKAPRRVALADVTKSKIPFLEGYEYDADGDSLALAVEPFQGGWDFQLEPVEGNWYEAGIYYVAPHYFYVDVEQGAFALQTGVFASDQWSVPTDSVNWVESNDSKTRTKVYGDTTMYLSLVTEDYVFDRDTLADFMYGYIMEDGSMYLPDGFTYLVEYDCTTTTETQTRANPRANWSESTYATADTVFGGRTTDYFRDTYFLNPTGKHTFDMLRYTDGATGSFENEVYMFQKDDTTVVVWNLWGLAFPGNVMNIDKANGTMEFPIQVCQLYDYTEAKEHYEGQYPQYVSYFDWSDANYILNVDLEWDEANNTIVLDDQYNEPVELNTAITGTVDDDLTIKWNATALTAYFYFNNNAIPAGGYYPFLHNVLSLYEVEPSFLRGDANDDGAVTIDDVTALIDGLLSGDYDSLGEGADCNLDGSITIDDVTALIDYLLSNVWND